MTNVIHRLQARKQLVVSNVKASEAFRPQVSLHQAVSARSALLDTLDEVGSSSGS